MSAFMELILDYFAGGGGASTGIEWALGRDVDYAVNHCLRAQGMYRINHPRTKLLPKDVFEIDPLALTKGRPVGMIWFSPDCKHHSKAKGGKPLDKKIRGLVLVMLKYAKIRARVMFMENVEEIQKWGPLKWMRKKIKGKWEWGWYPDPKHIGRTWRAFLDCLGGGIAPNHPDIPEILEALDGYVTQEELVRGFGYHHEGREIRGWWHGSPTIRKRYFMVARCDGKAIVWPEPGYAEPKLVQGHDGPTWTIPEGLRPWATIAEKIDWSQPCHSIFLTPKQARAVGCKRPLVKKTLQRLAMGVDRFILKAAEPFLINLTHQGGERVESVNEPARTVTGARRGEKGVVMPKLAGVLVGSGGPAYGGKPRAVDRPMKALVTENHTALGVAHLAGFVTEHANASNQRNMDVNAPLRTQCAEVKGGHFALAAASMIKMRGQNVGSGMDEPMHTISAGGTHHGVVAATVVRHFGASVGQPVDAPAPTVMCKGGGKTAVGFAYLAQHNGGFNETPGHDAREPMSTITGRGTQQQVIAATAVAYYGSEKDGQGMDEPARTATTKARFGLVEANGLVPPLTAEQERGARRVAKFLRAHGVQFEGEYATVRGYVIVDLGMRMLTPRELFRAQGFPDYYVIDRAWVIEPKSGKWVEITLTKEEQIRMCGNSVCPDVAAALVGANVPELRRGYTDATQAGSPAGSVPTKERRRAA